MDRMSFVRALRSGLLLFTCCIAIPALGDDIYFTIEGANQGKIVGDEMQKGLEGKMRALSFNAQIAAPYDKATGQMTGNREHRALRVAREPGRGTPQLLHAMAMNELLKEVRFDFYKPRIVNGVKVMSLYQTIKLTNARLVGFERARTAATDLSVRSVEELDFTYARIEIIDVERNVSGEILWPAPI